MSAAAKCVDSVFEHLGVDAVLDPDDAAKPVKLLIDEGDEVRSFRDAEFLSEGGVYQIRKADFAGFGDGVEFEINGERRKVQSHKVRDKRRLKVILDTIEVK